MVLTSLERILVVGNVAVVAAFGGWALGAVYGYIPVSLCCTASENFELVLAALNYPSWVAATMTSAWLFPEASIGGIVAKQIAWSALVIPQWLAYIFVFRKLRQQKAQQQVQGPTSPPSAGPRP